VCGSLRPLLTLSIWRQIMFKTVTILAVLASISIVIPGCSDQTPDAAPAAKAPSENIIPSMDLKKEKGLVSLDSEIIITVTVRNKTKGTVTMYWLDETDGQRALYNDIAPGGELDQDTYDGHYWIIADKNEKALGLYKMPKDDGVIIVK
jgi:hypothetical protein